MSILPWLIQRLADRYHAKAGNLQAYKARYSDAIDTILTMVEAGKKPELKVLNVSREVWKGMVGHTSD